MAEATSYSDVWIRQIVRRYNEHKAEELGDRRHNNRGVEGLLSSEQGEQLGEALQSPPSDGGMWNSRKVAEWIQEHTGRKVRAQRGW